MCMYVCIYIYIYIYRERDICMYVCMYVCMCVYIYIYTHVTCLRVDRPALSVRELQRRPRPLRLEPLREATPVIVVTITISVSSTSFINIMCIITISVLLL